MLKRYHHAISSIFKLTDASVIGLSWIVAYGVRFYFPIFEVTKGFPPFSQYAALCPLVVVLWFSVFSSLKIYQSRRMLRRTHEAHLILHAHGIAMLFFIAITYLISEYRYSRAVMVYFGFIGAFLLVGFRLFLRNTLRSIRKRGYNLRYVIGVGEGKALETSLSRIHQFPEMGLRVLGIVTHESSTAQELYGEPVLGHFNEIQSIIHKTQADQVLLVLPRAQAGELDRILKLLKDETVDVQLIPDIHEYITLGCEIENFDGLPVVNLNNTPLLGPSAFLKRTTDLMISGVALILLSPLLLLIAGLIKFTSKGGIFYVQERMGLDGQTFRMLKFRSMRMDAESQEGPVWAQVGDPRRTPLGTFLRRTSLDELPQLWNVLCGDMSLVGPRPERPIFVQHFRDQIPHYMLRHKVKAGITGWAQVNGWRGNTSLDRRIECDLYYIRNWSYGLDLKIILLTLWKGFIHKNAY